MVPLLAALAFTAPLLDLSSVELSSLQKPRFEDEIVAFEKSDREMPVASGAVLFVGSSSIRMWDSLKKDFPEYRVLNRGYGGSWLEDSVRLYPRVIKPYKPSAIVLFAGTNDLADNHTPEQVARDFRELVKLIRADQPKVPIAFISITPAPSRWANLANVTKANALIKVFASATPNVFYIDAFDKFITPDGEPKPELFREDQLHLKPEGYAIWKDIVGKSLHSFYPPRRR